ncbi:hypothetical protein HBI55_240910 [Parastagonospora nodorum]|nr:hypothetical protein HBH95_017730 [Parastagonospora nodorum]KAH5621108.1 hypothetical protein HBI22_200930 [Parastagonospora nodorum]KAH6481416.1 hypothetical protein HBI55_240910 [Parastagonospora nodorum]
MLILILSKIAQRYLKLEKNYFKIIDILIIMLIKNNNNLLGTINSYIKLSLKCYKTKIADSRYAKLKKTKDKKKLAKAKKEKEKKEA